MQSKWKEMNVNSFIYWHTRIYCFSSSIDNIIIDLTEFGALVKLHQTKSAAQFFIDLWSNCQLIQMQRPINQEKYKVYYRVVLLSGEQSFYQHKSLSLSLYTHTQNLQELIAQKEISIYVFVNIGGWWYRNPNYTVL